MTALFPPYPSIARSVIIQATTIIQKAALFARQSKRPARERDSAQKRAPAEEYLTGAAARDILEMFNLPSVDISHFLLGVKNREALTCDSGDCRTSVMLEDGMERLLVERCAQVVESFKTTSSNPTQFWFNKILDEIAAAIREPGQPRLEPEDDKPIGMVTEED